MRTWLIGALMVGLAGAFVPSDVDAKRLGGGRAAGMQRTAPDKPAQAPQTPAQPAATPNNTPNAPAAAAAPATTGAAAAAAAPKRSWMGPIAGLAAGIGLAALFTHLGWGEGLANFVMLMLLAVIAVVAIRWLVRRFSGGAAARERTPFAMAGAGAGTASTQALRTATRIEPTVTTAPQIAAPASAASPAAPAALPADFDAAAFERIAKMIFIRLQAANDKADANDLRAFTTPELFSSLKVDLQDRGNADQQTDVVTLNAELLDFAQENERQIVSVRFHGLIREEAHNGAEPFDEVWHLVRPAGGQGNSWAIAGIQPRQ